MENSRGWSCVGVIVGLVILVVGLNLFASDPAPPAKGYVDAVVTSHGAAGRSAALRVSDGQPVNGTCTVRDTDFASGRLPAVGTFFSVERIGDRCHPRVYADRSVNFTAVFWGLGIAAVSGFVLWSSFRDAPAPPARPAASKGNPGPTRRDRKRVRARS